MLEFRTQIEEVIKKKMRQGRDNKKLISIMLNNITATFNLSMFIDDKCIVSKNEDARICKYGIQSFKNDFEKFCRQNKLCVGGIEIISEVLFNIYGVKTVTHYYDSQRQLFYQGIMRAIGKKEKAKKIPYEIFKKVADEKIKYLFGEKMKARALYEEIAQGCAAEIGGVIDWRDYLRDLNTLSAHFDKWIKNKKMERYEEFNERTAKYESHGIFKKRNTNPSGSGVTFFYNIFVV